MPQSLASLSVHIIFSTKGRTPLLDQTLQPRLWEYIGGIVRHRGCRLLAAGGTPDHVHLLVSMSRDRSISDTVRDVKSNSSRWIHETYPHLPHFAWQAGYGAFSVSQSNLDEVTRYIANQLDHHHRIGFQDEYRAFLNRHDIPFDEQHVWD